MVLRKDDVSSGLLYVMIMGEGEGGGSMAKFQKQFECSVI